MHRVNSPNIFRKVFGLMNLFFFAAPIFVLDVFWDVVLCFSQLSSYLNILKYPKFSSFQNMLKSCKIFLYSSKCPKKIIKKEQELCLVRLPSTPGRVSWSISHIITKINANSTRISKAVRWNGTSPFEFEER